MSKRPGGRVVILATNWKSVVWHADQPARMERVLSAWRAHAPYPDLPSILVARLRQSGLTPIRQSAAPVLNTSYHANGFSYYLARMIRPFVAGRQAVTQEDADAWLAEFEALEQRGAYFFSSTPIITEAIKVE